MSEDFFGDLGKSISKATQQAVDRTSTFFESTKISARISGEQKEIEKLYQNIGESVYRQVQAGKFAPASDIKAVIDEIKGHENQIDAFKQNLANVKGMKVCPNCKEVIPSDVAFCPKCGAPTPIAKEVKPAEAEPEVHEEVKDAVEKAEAAVKEEAEETAEKAEETVTSAAEKAEDVVSSAAEKAEDAVKDVTKE